MKTALKISLASNLVLLGSMAFMLVGPGHRPQPAASFRPVGATLETPALPILTSASSKPAPTSPSPFRWNQLDDKDYHVYVKNLRAIGCPEATVRAIVVADVHAAYRVRYDTLEEKMADLAKSSWTVQLGAPDSETALRNKLQDLPTEEAAEVADLLGLKPAAATVAANVSSPGVPISVPLILQDADLSTLDLSDDQKEAIARVRQDFLKQIGGTNQDANDPAYLARWQQAQPDADNMLQAMLGNDLYARYEIIAHQKALDDQAAAH